VPKDKTAGRIECASNLLAAGFVQTPVIILRDKDLSAGAKLIYGALLWYLWRGGAYPGQVEMAEEFGIGERSVRRYLSELEKCGYLTVKRHGLGQPNTYTLMCPWEANNPDRPIWPVKAANMAGQGGQYGRNSLLQEFKTHNQQQQAPRKMDFPADSPDVVVASSEHPNAQVLTDRLTALGVTKSTTKKLLKDHDHAFVYRWLCYTEHRLQSGWVPKETPAAWLVSAIRSDDWVIPDWFQTPAEQAAEREHKQRVAQAEQQSRAEAADQERQEAAAQRFAIEQELGIGERTRGVWQQTLDLLEEQGQMTPALLSAFLLPLDGSEATIATPVKFFGKVIAENADVIQAALEEVVGESIESVAVKHLQLEGTDSG
jgi:hypothetical protein